MKLIRFIHRQDFGHEWYVQILSTGKHVPRPFRDWCFFQGSISWNEYPSWPYIQIKSGMGALISVLFCVYKFGFDFGIIERTWNFERLDDLRD